MLVVSDSVGSDGVGSDGAAAANWVTATAARSRFRALRDMMSVCGLLNRDEKYLACCVLMQDGQE